MNLGLNVGMVWSAWAVALVPAWTGDPAWTCALGITIASVGWVLAHWQAR